MAKNIKRGNWKHKGHNKKQYGGTLVVIGDELRKVNDVGRRIFDRRRTPFMTEDELLLLEEA